MHFIIIANDIYLVFVREVVIKISQYVNIMWERFSYVSAPEKKNYI